MIVVKPADLAEGAADLHAESGTPSPALVVVDLDDLDQASAERATQALHRRRHALVVGHATTPLPRASRPLLERLTCTIAPDGPGWLTTPGNAGTLEAMRAVVSAAPRAAVTLDRVLRVNELIGVDDGLAVESLAYSTLLTSAEFASWRSRTPRRAVPDVAEPVLLDRSDDVLTVTLNRPERRNAFGRAVRDGLLAALELAELDSTVREVVVRGQGRSFCSGGDLDEFGTTTDGALSHLLRLQLSAGLAVHRLAGRMRFVLHGACIGAGVEVPSFAHRIEAGADAYFQLPELSMGLIPGAGGTVSMIRRIGRWRTASMALTAEPIDAETALAWGLVDDLV